MRQKVSRAAVVGVVTLCLLVSALLLPAAAHLPRFVEIELVLGAWWIVWVVVLTLLLYLGKEVDDSHTPHFAARRSKIIWEVFWLSLQAGGCAVAEGCLIVVVVLLVGVLVALALTLLVELVIPAIALLLLVSIGGMAARAANDTHGCAGRFGMSLLWGMLWATVYVGPLAAIVVWVSVLITKH